MTGIIYHELNDLLYVSPIALYMETTASSAAPIAIRLVIDPLERNASWHDTIRNRSIKFENSTLNSDKIILITEDGSEWTFVPLTLGLYSMIKDTLVSNDTEFNSDEEVQTYYSTVNF